MGTNRQVINLVNKLINGGVKWLNSVEGSADYKLVTSLIHKPYSLAMTRLLTHSLQSTSNYSVLLSSRSLTLPFRSTTNHSNIAGNSTDASEMKALSHGGEKEEPHQQTTALRPANTDHNRLSSKQHLQNSLVSCPKYHIKNNNSSAVNQNTNTKRDNNEPLNRHNNEKILELNDMNFRSVVPKYKLLLVLFYAPWCKYCTDMKPRYYRAAKELPKTIGSLAVCDADASNKVALKYEVYVFPTLKLFHHGKYLIDYSGPRRSLELIKFMTEQSKKIEENS